MLDTVAGTLTLGGPERAVLAAPIDAAVAAGWEPAVLAAHLTADPTTDKIKQPGGWLMYRLTGTRKTGVPALPEGPTVCPCTACRRHVRQVEAAIRQQTAELDRARQRHAEQTDDPGRARYETITEALGAALHGRIVAAEFETLRTGRFGANLAGSLAQSPKRIRAVVGGVYGRYGHDIAAIRTYAESLPPAGQPVPAVAASA